MAKVYYETNMDKLPDSCSNCTMYGCSLPECKGRNDKIQKAYLTKRHKQCPLKEVENG